MPRLSTTGVQSGASEDGLALVMIHVLGVGDHQRLPIELDIGTGQQLEAGYLAVSEALEQGGLRWLRVGLAGDLLLGRTLLRPGKLVDLPVGA